MKHFCIIEEGSYILVFLTASMRQTMDVIRKSDRDLLSGAGTLHCTLTFQYLKPCFRRVFSNKISVCPECLSDTFTLFFFVENRVHCYLFDFNKTDSKILLPLIKNKYWIINSFCLVIISRLQQNFSSHKRKKNKQQLWDCVLAELCPFFSWLCLLHIYTGSHFFSNPANPIAYLTFWNMVHDCNVMWKTVAADSRPTMLSGFLLFCDCSITQKQNTRHTRQVCEWYV